MLIRLRYLFSSLLLIPIYSFCEEISWDVGLTSDRELISAKGILKKIDAPTILYLAGLTGPSQSALSINTLFEDYLGETDESGPNLIIIPLANPQGESLNFPPEGNAFSENSVSHALWRWIGTHAPDLIILEGGEDFGFEEAVTSDGIAGFGLIPLTLMTESNTKVSFLESMKNLQPSIARNELEKRVARTPRGLAEQLAAVYGHDFSSPVYVPGMSVIGRLRLGYEDDVDGLIKPYLKGETIEITDASTLAGQLVFAHYYENTGDEESLRLILEAAELAFDDNGDPSEAAPMHNEMSDSFFMATPLLVKAGKFTGSRKFYDMAALHIIYMSNLLLRPNGLYRHSPEADVAWSRGNGFAALGLALALTDFPKELPTRDIILGFLADQLTALLPHQDSDGMWREVIDYPGSFAEITSTAMIGTAIKRGLDQGWLSEEIFRPALQKAWHAVKVRTSFEGVFVNACTSTGKMASLDAYLDRLAIFDTDDRAGRMVMNIAIAMADL
mgnify:CR=1 FL=1